MVRPGQLPAAGHRPGLLERAGQHRSASACSRPCRSCCSRSCLAHLLNHRLRGRTFFRMGVLLPNVTSRGRGHDHLRPALRPRLRPGQLGARPGRRATRSTGRPARWSSWIGDLDHGDWRWTGYNALIYLAAMQAIPRELYEAAAIDGASAVAAVPADHHPDAAPDDHLHRHRLDHRRPAAVRRAAAVQRRPTRPPAARTASSRPLALYLYENGFGRSSTSATPRRSPGCCSSSSSLVVGAQLPAHPPARGGLMPMALATPADRTAPVGDRTPAAQPGRGLRSPGRPADLRRAGRRRPARSSRSTGRSSSRSDQRRRSAQVPPPLLARRPPVRQHRRVFDNDDAHFGKALVNSLLVAGTVTLSRGALLDAGRVRLRQAALPRPQRAAACW